MKADRIIGRVGANVLNMRLTDSKLGERRSADSKALFRLDQLAPNQIGSIVREILANPVLSTIVDLRISTNACFDIA